MDLNSPIEISLLVTLLAILPWLALFTVMKLIIDE